MTGSLQVLADGHELTRISNYTASEDATPLDLADTSGSVGGLSIAYTTQKAPNIAKRRRRKTLSLNDRKNGQWTGVVQASSGGRINANLTVNSRLTLLAVTRTADPQTSTLSAAIIYYLGLCGVTGGYAMPDRFATITVHLPGWRDQVWLRLKQLAAVYQFEIALVSDSIVFRDPRTNIAQTYRDSDLQWTAADGQLASSVKVMWYPTTRLDVQAVYPPNRSFDGLDLITFEANEIKTVELPLTASVASIVQPSATDSTYDNAGLSRSEFVVSDATNHIVLPKMWHDYGGRLSAKIGYQADDGTWINDTHTVTLTITGPGLAGLSPFTLGLPTGDGNYEPALTILGTGVDQQQRSITVDTGLPPDLVQNDVAAVIDSTAIQSEGDAFTIASRALPALLGATQTISGASAGINRLGDSGDVSAAPLSTFDAAHAGQTLAQFDATETGHTLGDFDSEQYAALSTQFPNQAFGNINGARRYFDFAWYRITQAQISRSAVSYSASIDTIASDFDAVWTGKTLADFDAAWTGATLGDLEMAPLAPTVPM